MAAMPERKVPANRYTPNMSLYHSGSRPEIQSKATMVTVKKKATMNRGASLRALMVKAASLLSSWRKDPRTKKE
jgi:hypothetical protein